jgi:sulfate adenylyltransferase subunit 2
MSSYNLTHLKQLEAESIHIIREVAAEFKKPVMLYSVGKDSAVMTHLALKAFYPAKPPFPFLHVDTTWKFKEMIAFRDNYVKIDPGENSEKHTEVMKTDSLKQALTKYGFDAAFGGARRDEEKSRAKERVFSFRDKFHRWDPKNQRPELWNLYNSKVNPGESIRVFPLSNWTELDVWQYIYLENIPLPDLYFAKMLPVVWRNGTWIHLNDDRMKPRPGEKVEHKMIRFRTLGCYPLTGGVESTATTLPEIIQEMLLTTTSERQGRVIDKDGGGAGMELKKTQGYF